ncbi:hypothetical protein K501DRAFT_176265, partial [Backusella circina FSU 941]
ASFCKYRIYYQFFLTRLDHDELNVMYEIDHLESSSSLAHLLVFASLKSLNILLFVCYIFWKLCKKSDIPSIMPKISKVYYIDGLFLYYKKKFTCHFFFFCSIK